MMTASSFFSAVPSRTKKHIPIGLDFDCSLTSFHLYNFLTEKCPQGTQEEQMKIAMTVEPLGGAARVKKIIEDLIRHEVPVAILSFNEYPQIVYRYLNEKIGLSKETLSKIKFVCFLPSAPIQDKNEHVDIFLEQIGEPKTTKIIMADDDNEQLDALDRSNRLQERVQVISKPDSDSKEEAVDSYPHLGFLEAHIAKLNKFLIPSTSISSDLNPVTTEKKNTNEPFSSVSVPVELEIEAKTTESTMTNFISVSQAISIIKNGLDDIVTQTYGMIPTNKLLALLGYGWDSDVSEYTKTLEYKKTLYELALKENLEEFKLAGKNRENLQLEMILAKPLALEAINVVAEFKEKYHVNYMLYEIFQTSIPLLSEIYELSAQLSASRAARDRIEFNSDDPDVDPALGSLEKRLAELALESNAIEKRLAELILKRDSGPIGVLAQKLKKQINEIEEAITPKEQALVKFIENCNKTISDPGKRAHLFKHFFMLMKGVRSSQFPRLKTLTDATLTQLKNPWVNPATVDLPRCAPR